MGRWYVGPLNPEIGAPGIVVKANVRLKSLMISELGGE
jgi:hypothetical protein